MGMDYYTCDECEEIVWEEDRVAFEIENYDGLLVCEDCAKEYSRQLIPKLLPNYIYIVETQDGTRHLLDGIEDLNELLEVENGKRYGCYMSTSFPKQVQLALQGKGMEMKEIENILKKAKDNYLYRVVWVDKPQHAYHFSTNKGSNITNVINSLRQYIIDNNLQENKLFLITPSGWQDDNEQTCQVLMNLSNGSHPLIWRDTLQELKDILQHPNHKDVEEWQLTKEFILYKIKNKRDRINKLDVEIKDLEQALTKL